MSKRKELIENKLDEKSKIDFEEIKEEDSRSMRKIIANEEDTLHDVKKSIKKFQEDPKLVIGMEFINLVEEKTRLEDKIKFLNKIKEDYV